MSSSGVSQAKLPPTSQNFAAFIPYACAATPGGRAAEPRAGYGRSQAVQAEPAHQENVIKVYN